MLTKKYPPLYINIDKYLLNILLTESRKNFFNFLYYKTDYYFFKQDRSFLSKYFFKQYKKLTKEEAFDIYNRTGFDEVLNLLKNKDYKDLFENYDLIYHLNNNKVFEMPIGDLKLLLEVSNLNFSTIKEYEKNQ